MEAPSNISPGERIRLRVLDMQDISPLVAGLNDWNVAQWLPTVPFPYREEDAEVFIAACGQTSPPPAYAVTDGATGELLGVIGLTRDNSMAELGYWLLPRHHGKGFMGEAIEHLIARQDNALVAIFATVDPANTRSMRVLEKAGFRFTGEHTRETPNRQGNLLVLRYQRDLGKPA